jgi:glyoxylase-like metal-dependent hydrolase (beta-lactamase superfamily II)
MPPPAQSLRPDVKSAIGVGANAKADVQLSAGDVITLGSLQLKVLPTPGHTQGCSSYYLTPGPNRVGMVFTGACTTHGIAFSGIRQAAGRMYSATRLGVMTPDQVLAATSLLPQAPTLGPV